MKEENLRLGRQVKGLIGTACGGIEKMKNAQVEIRENMKELQEYVKSIGPAADLIVEKTKIEAAKREKIVSEERKIQKVEVKKSVIPSNFKKKVSALPRSEDIDLERELGNSFN